MLLDWFQEYILSLDILQFDTISSIGWNLLRGGGGEYRLYGGLQRLSRSILRIFVWFYIGFLQTSAIPSSFPSFYISSNSCLRNFNFQLFVLTVCLSYSFSFPPPVYLLVISASFSLLIHFSSFPSLYFNLVSSSSSFPRNFTTIVIIVRPHFAIFNIADTM